MSKGKTQGDGQAEVAAVALAQMTGALQKYSAQTQEIDEAQTRKRLGLPNPGTDLLSNLERVVSLEGTLWNTAWALCLDGESPLTDKQRALLSPLLNRSGSPQAWDCIDDCLAKALTLPQVRQNPQATRLAVLFLQLTQVAAVTDSLDLLAKAFDLAHGQRAAAKAKRATTRQFEQALEKRWKADAAAGNPKRGRVPRVTYALQQDRSGQWRETPETTVRSAVKRLQEAGRLQDD